MVVVLGEPMTHSADGLGQVHRLQAHELLTSGAMAHRVHVKVQSTQLWGILGFYIRNRSWGFGQIPYNWVLGPLGNL